MENVSSSSTEGAKIFPRVIIVSFSLEERGYKQLMAVRFWLRSKCLCQAHKVDHSTAAQIAPVNLFHNHTVTQ